MYELHHSWIVVRYNKNKTNHLISNFRGRYKTNEKCVSEKDQMKLWQAIAVKTWFFISKWISYREAINVLIKWHKTHHFSIICLQSYVIRMNIYVFVDDRSSDHRSIIARLSSDCRAMNGRWSTDAKQKSSHEWSAVHILMWMRVIARFERVKLGKSADRHLKFWSPDHKF